MTTGTTVRAGCTDTQATGTTITATTLMAAGIGRTASVPITPNDCSLTNVRNRSHRKVHYGTRACAQE